MKNNYKQIIVFVFLIISILTAQPAFPNSPNQAPIGGLGLLAAIGGAMALKKLLDRKKNQD
ncbi:MAG: hypothetical protein ACE5D0_03480 [Fidelibacterota bacterium]